MNGEGGHVHVLVGGPSGISGPVTCVCCLEDFPQSEISAHDLDLLGYLCVHCTVPALQAEAELLTAGARRPTPEEHFKLFLK